jgi:hypothetical protein
MKFRIFIFGICASAFFIMAILRIFGFHGVYHTIFYIWTVVIDFPWYRPFIDTHIVVAAIQCHREGIDVFVANPCDLAGRQHIYSPIWLAASTTGLTVDDVEWVGTVLSMLFFAACAWIFNGVNRRETALYLLALFSQAVVLAVDRGNFDMLMFSMIVAACWFFSRNAVGRILAYLLIYFAAILKFYPIVAFGLALTEKPIRLIRVAVTAAIAWFVFICVVWSDLLKILPHMPHAQPLEDAFGGFNAFQALSHLAIRYLPNHDAIWVGAGDVGYLAAIIAAFLISFGLARKLIVAGVSIPMTEMAPSLYLAGAFIIIFAFFSAQNPPYRAIWLLLLIPTLLALRRNSQPAYLRRGFGGALALLVFLMWFEFFHTWIGRLTGSNGARDMLAFFVREPAWWIFVTIVMALAWVQLSATPTFRWVNRGLSPGAAQENWRSATADASRSGSSADISGSAD